MCACVCVKSNEQKNNELTHTLRQTVRWFSFLKVMGCRKKKEKKVIPLTFQNPEGIMAVGKFASFDERKSYTNQSQTRHPD